ncbi:DUF4058 family protein [Chlorogloeopsis sp. ULAP01]|uniref:DUF4058 family protein n=1 Tax=Chlorogloeopsis sp. ULAP01 TaxID=3056483 RepID=UPI0030148E83
MENPFLGMNPYLEQPELWHQVHNRLIVVIAPRGCLHKRNFGEDLNKSDRTW